MSDVEAVGKPSSEFRRCHADNSTAQIGLYGPISGWGMVKGPSQYDPIDPSGGFSTASLELMIPPERIRDAGEYVEWLRLAVHEKELPGTNRTRAAGSCFAIAQDHHHAIVLLVEHRLYASAFSLLRSAFEAYVRGQWLAHCATDSQIEKYLRDWSPPKIDILLAAVEKTPGFSEQVLSRVKAKGWDTMCAYTHTGGLHIQRWNTSDGIEPNYSPEEVFEVLAFAEFVGLMSVMGMAELANDEALALRLLNKIKERTGK